MKDVTRQHYQTKQRQQKQAGLRCPGCGCSNPTQSHHLFIRRPDHPLLQADWNIVQVCPKCHLEERYEMQLRAALWKLEQYGPDYIEQKVAELPFKVKHLPKHYWEAKQIWEAQNEIQGVSDASCS